MTTFLVTGGGGFIGSHLLAHRAMDDTAVVVVGRDGLSLYRNGRLDGKVQCDIGNGVWSFDAINVDTIDCVFHLATRYIVDHDAQNISKLVDDNIKFAAHMLDAVAKFKPRVIVAESYWQYAINSTDYRSNNLYAATKNAAGALFDYYADGHDLEIIRAVIGDTYGPKDTRNKLIYSLVEAALTGSEVKLGDPEHQLTLLHVSDVVKGLLCLSGMPHVPDQQIFNLCSGDITSLANLVRATEIACERQLDVVWGQHRRRAANLPPWRQGIVPPGWSQSVHLDEGLRELVRGIQNEAQ